MITVVSFRTDTNPVNISLKDISLISFITQEYVIRSNCIQATRKSGNPIKG